MNRCSSIWLDAWVSEKQGINCFSPNRKTNVFTGNTLVIFSQIYMILYRTMCKKLTSPKLIGKRKNSDTAFFLNETMCVSSCSVLYEWQFFPECNCNGHSDRCKFDPAVYEANGGISGGVCLDCQHNTMGRNCQQCTDMFYQDPYQDIRSSTICKRES